MYKRIILFTYCFVAAICTLYSQSYFAYIETFGNPETALIEAGNPEAGLAPSSITDNPVPITVLGVSQRTPVNYGAQAGIGPGWNLSANYCNESNYGRYGVITSNLFDSSVPVSSKDNTGNGFFAFFRRYIGYTSVVRVCVPADRVVPGEKYTFSGWIANGYGANVENCEATSPEFKIRMAHFPSNISEDGMTYDGTWARSDIPTVFNSSTWTSITKEAPMAAEEGKGMHFEIICNATKASIVMIDSLSVYGKRPVISGTFIPIEFSVSAEESILSEVRNLSCNHAGTTPITLSISGNNKANFILCDEAGNPFVNNTLPKTGGSYRVKFTPDNSESNGNYTAILTINAATSPVFGAKSQEIILTGSTTTDISSAITKSKLTIFPNPVEKELTFIHGNAGERADISIFDISGKQIAVQSGHPLNTPINVSNLSTGSYVVQLTLNNQKKLIYRFIKK